MAAISVCHECSVSPSVTSCANPDWWSWQTAFKNLGIRFLALLARAVLVEQQRAQALLEGINRLENGKTGEVIR
jgi:hypothetical protein